MAMLVAVAFTLTACGGSSSDPVTPADPAPSGGGSVSATTTDLDAASNTTEAAYLDLASGHTVAATDKWHMSYQKYVGFKTNGGASGTGGVTVCLAKEYPALFDSSGRPVKTEFEALTGTNTLADFVAVKKTDCADTDYKTDSIKTAIKTSDWLNASYGGGQPTFSAKTDASNGWIVRSASKDAATDAYSYARVKVKTVTVVLGASPSRKVVLSSEKWNTATSAFDTAVDSPELDFSSTQVFWDLETNAIVASTTDWDLSIKVDGQDYPIQVNGGVSGSGKAGVGIILSGGVAGVTDPTNTSQVYKYFGDKATGALSGPGSYGPLQYGAGGGHKMWPTFAVYIFKDDTKFYKAQVISNYGADGTSTSANLVVRYEELTD